MVFGSARLHREQMEKDAESCKEGLSQGEDAEGDFNWLSAKLRSSDSTGGSG
jgi:hypothetical protein